MKLRRNVLAVMLCVMSMGFVYAASDNVAHDVQINVNEVVIVGLNSTLQINLATVAPGAAGDPVTGTSDSSKQLRYTSLALGNRTVRASFAGSVPNGTALHLEASAVPALCGTAVGGGVTLTAVDQDIITAIGSCNTTTTNGATLTYTLNIPTPTSLVAGASSTVTVTLTLTDAV